MASVAEIKAISYEVCGVVQMVNPGHKVKVNSGVSTFRCI